MKEMCETIVTRLVLLLMLALPLQAAAMLAGDVNDDDAVDVADITTLINYVLGNGGDEMNLYLADVNQDGEVDVTDVTELINHVLNGAELPAPMDEITVNGVTFVMVPVKGGTFMMGATSEQGSDGIDRERPVHEVTLDSYSIGQTEVTQDLWTAVMGSNPSYFRGGQYPVERVSWTECQTFIAQLNVMTGRDFRLPTEAEWEFAARGGSESLDYKYAGGNEVATVAWYSGNDSWQTKGTGTYGTHPVATRNPNELMLYDMSGNVHEWCQDWFGDYESGAQVNPAGPSAGSDRVYRGGSWYFDEWFCRVSFRNGVAPGYQSYGIGLRLAY